MPLTACKKCGTWYMSGENDDGLCAVCTVDAIAEKNNAVTRRPR